MLRTHTAILVPTVSSTLVLDEETSVLLRLNTLLNQSGLHLPTTSTQLHIMPENVHILSSENVAFFSHHARLFVSHKAVQCDFSALCDVLWSHVKRLGTVLDNFLRSSLDEGTRLQETVLNQLTPHVVFLGNVFNILHHIEEPFARREVRSAVNIVQQDVEMAVRVAMKVLRVLDNVIRNMRQNETATIKMFLREAELCLARTELCAASITTRDSVDLSPVLTFLNSDLTWRLSGVGEVLTAAYCEAVCRLIRVILSRKNDFVGVEEVATQLLLHRLADRPPFDWGVFQCLYVFNNTGKLSVGAPTPQYGLLRYMSIVQLCLESLFSSDESWTKALRRLGERALRQLNQKRQMLSFFQVLVLAAVEGMPEADFADDAQLQRRATTTRLIAGDGETRVLHSNFLRILLAHGFTVLHMRHSALSQASVFLLFRAIVEQLFQLPSVESGDMTALTDLLLVPPVMTERIFQLIVDAAAADNKIACEVLAEVRQITKTIYVANTLQCASLLSTKRMPLPLQRLSVFIMGLLFKFFDSEAFLSSTDRFIALESLGRVFAVRAFYVSASNDPNDLEKKHSALRFISKMTDQLLFLARRMTAKEVNSFFENVILPCNSTEELGRKNRQQYALQEAYVRAFASPAVAIVIDEEIMLRHWVDVSIRCITNDLSGALSLAGLEFLSAAFLSRRPLAPLFVPTYVSLMIPLMNSPHHDDPPLFLVRNFAKTVRATCQAVEECDERALATMLDNPNSSLRSFLQSSHAGGKDMPSLGNLRPISCVLLIVSSLFEKVCQLLRHRVRVGVFVFTKEEQYLRFGAYFSALVNLLQCRQRAVLHRVCASVEVVVLEHLNGAAGAQAQWMRHIASLVDSIDGVCKRELVEWLLTLTRKTKSATPAPHL